MSQMKEQNKTPEKELNKIKISNLLDAEFKTRVIRMFHELSENLNIIKKYQSEMKDTITEMKNNLQGINSTVDEAKNQISNLEYKEAKNTQSEEKKESSPHSNEDSVRSHNFMSTNISIMGCEK